MADYASLGIKPVINATGTVTSLGGSIMPSEVTAAWTLASKHFVDMIDLQNKVGKRIAHLLQVEGALVTSGAAAAILLGTAAVVTHEDPSLIPKLPSTTGLRNEVILQKSHHSAYDSQLTGAGVKLVDVETIDELNRAINPRTALMFYMNDADSFGKIQRAEWAAAAQRNKIRTLMDASADVPPVDRISQYIRMGFDLLAVSGGKAIRGPNDTGLLLGRRELIEVAKLNASPNEPTIGRSMKVGKEDMMALLTAIERFVQLDHKAEWAEMERRIAVIEQSLHGIPSVECERIVPPVANHQPHLIVDWDESKIRKSRQQVTEALMSCDSPIQIGRVAGTGDKGILIAVLALQPGEERIVADALRSILTAT